MDRLKGADPTSLENKIQQYYGSEDSEDGDSSVRGHVSVSVFYYLYVPEMFSYNMVLLIFFFTDGSINIYP